MLPSTVRIFYPLYGGGVFLKNQRGKIAVFKSLTILVCSAFLAAISIVLGKYLAIPGGDILRFSFENLPIIMAGMIFGPLVGASVGVVADLIGCVMVGYVINPLVTAGAAAIGFVSGIVYMITGEFEKCPHSLRITLTVSLSHLIGSVLIKTFGLSSYYSVPIWTLMLYRFLNYLIVGVLEGIILWYLMKNKQIKAQINSILGKK